MATYKVDEKQFYQQETLQVGTILKTTQGSEYKVIGFTKPCDGSKDKKMHASAILLRGNGKTAYTVTITGTRKLWNRNIISVGVWNHEDDAKLEQ